MFKKNIYKINSDLPFRINRTKIDLFFDCKRCFYLDQKHGIRRPHGTPLVLNNKIVDDFKKELNECRINKKVHPEIIKLKKQFIPLFHSKLDDWRSSFKGARFLHSNTNLVVSGIIDDIWNNPLIIFGMGIGDNFLYIHFYYIKILCQCLRQEFSYT